MRNRWHQSAVIYCVEIDVFRDGNGDGVGDFVGLGVNCFWLLPFYPSPRRDDSRDITEQDGSCWPRPTCRRTR